MNTVCAGATNTNRIPSHRPEDGASQLTGEERASSEPRPALGNGESEDALLVRAGRGDVQAFASLYDLLGPSVYGLARRVLRDRGFAEETCQEVFVELWRTAPRYEPRRGSARAWVLTLTHRRAVDRVRSEETSRRREMRQVLLDGDALVAPTEDAALTAVTARLDGARVRSVLAALSDVQRQAVELAYFDGLTYSEVATELDVPLGTIKTRVRDGLSRLRDALGVRS